MSFLVMTLVFPVRLRYHYIVMPYLWSRHWLIILTCILLGGALAVPACAADPYETLDRALSLITEGDAAGARSMIEEIDIAAVPPALRNAALAITDLCAGRYDDAEGEFHRALNDDPQHLPALWGMGLCLLRRGCAFEGAMFIDRAAVLAPHDPRITTLQAYAYMILGRNTEAAASAKQAVDAGETSPFLMAILAQLNRRMGYAARALEYGAFAARAYYGMDFLAKPTKINLPLTLVIADTPKVLSAVELPARSVYAQRTAIEMPAYGEEAKKAFAIVAPTSGMTLRGTQLVQSQYHGTTPIRFTVFQVDGVLRGMVNEMPYHFPWEADAMPPGEHTLCVRAYDQRGTVAAEDTVVVTTVGGKPLPAADTSAQQAKLQQKMLALTMPAPAPQSLFSHLGWWHRDLGETSQAIAAFEKAAAIDPEADDVLESLAKLYRKNGLHPISPTGEVKRAPISGKKRVALTFDDGPNPLYTPGILAELKRHRAHATFFLVGNMVQQYPQLTLDVLAEGHEIANHTYTHPNLTRLAQNEIIAEALRTRAVIKEITGRQTYLFRPPGGNIDSYVTKQLRALDYNIVYWNINAGEYVKLTSADQAQKILSLIDDGSIVLLHNGPVDGTLNILPTLLTELEKRGFTCVTVSDLMEKN